jgi:hypothetical protein
MQNSYRILKKQPLNYQACEGRTIKDFFQQTRLKYVLDCDSWNASHPS